MKKFTFLTLLFSLFSHFGYAFAEPDDSPIDDYSVVVTEDFSCTATATLSYNSNDPSTCNTCTTCNGSSNCAFRGVPVTASVSINYNSVQTLPSDWQMSWQILWNGSPITNSSSYIINTGTFSPTFFFDLCDTRLYSQGSWFGTAKIRLTLVNYNCQGPTIIIPFENDITFTVCGVAPPQQAPLVLPTFTPTTSQGFKDANKTIAYAFAPDFFQFVSTCPSDSEDGDADRILKVNFDGDWVADNNWENLVNLGPFYNFSPYGQNIYPNAYYNVLWTQNFWIVGYFYYYPRDYAKDEISLFPPIINFASATDEHEGDFTKVIAVIKRPLPGQENIDPKDLLLGITTRYHGDNDNLDCLSNDQVNSVAYSPTPSPLAIGAHPKVYSACGSHATYDDIESAYFDNPFNPFMPPNPFNPRPTSAILYKAAFSNGPLSEIDNLFDCAAELLSGDAQFIQLSANIEHYKLIDIFENSGIYDNLDNLTNGNYKFAGDNGMDEKTPGPPWDDDILKIISDNFGNSFDCDCRPGDVNCVPTSFTDDSFIYNPLACDYAIIGGLGLNPRVFSSTNSIDFNVKAIGPKNVNVLTEITWDFSTVPANAVTCTGCFEKEETVSFSSVTDPCSSAGIIELSITATIRTLDCGDIVVTKKADLIKPGPITGELSIIENTRPCPCHSTNTGSYQVVHSTTNFAPLTYSWSCQACEFTSNTNQSMVWAKEVGDCGYGPWFTVSATNGCGTITSPETQFPPCSGFDAGSDELEITPNPSGGLTNIKVHETNPSGNPNEVYHLIIVSQYSEVKFNGNSDSNEFDVNVSTWQDGMYYIMATKGNTIISKNFVVSHN